MTQFTPAVPWLQNLFQQRCLSAATCWGDGSGASELGWADVCDCCDLLWFSLSTHKFQRRFDEMIVEFVGCRGSWWLHLRSCSPPLWAAWHLKLQNFQFHITLTLTLTLVFSLYGQARQHDKRNGPHQQAQLRAETEEYSPAAVHHRKSSRSATMGREILSGMPNSDMQS